MWEYTVMVEGRARGEHTIDELVEVERKLLAELEKRNHARAPDHPFLFAGLAGFTTDRGVGVTLNVKAEGLADAASAGTALVWTILERLLPDVGGLREQAWIEGDPRAEEGIQWPVSA